MVVATFKDMVRFIGFNSYFCSYNYHLREDKRLNNDITINMMIVKERTMADLYEYSTPEIVRLMGTRFKDYSFRGA